MNCIIHETKLGFSINRPAWLVVEPPTPLKNDGVKVSWDDELPN